MELKTWEKAWNDKYTQELWSIPDHEVKGLLETLKNENVKKVLDVGFGLGRHIILFSKEGFDTYGIEPTQSGFDHCKEWLEVEGLDADIRIGDMAELPYENDFFDFVIAWNVIYHGTFMKLKKALAEIKRVTKEKGLVYVTLVSIRNEYYGKGKEVEPNTFLNPEKFDGDLLHHYSDEDEVRVLFRGWDVLYIKEAEQSYAGKIYQDTYHWMILTRA